MDREDPLHPDARRHFAHGEALADPGPPPADAGSLERLEPLLVPFLHLHHDLEGVSRPEVGKILAHARALQLGQLVHIPYPLSASYFAHRSGRRNLVNRSASLWRHAEMRA